MDWQTYRERIWENFQNTERATRYYSRLSHKFDKRQRLAVYGIAALSVLVITLLQFDWRIAGIREALVPGLLFLVALLELILINFDLSGSVKVARIYALESSKMASEWRKLWYAFDEQEQDYWVNFLESNTRQIALETVSYDKKLNEQCA